MQEIKTAAQNFKVFYAQVPGKTEGSYTVDHTAGTYVFDAQGKVRLFGVADRRLTGRRVTIRFTATNKIVARPLVRRTGLFTATAPLPRRKIRATNKARYIARIGKEKSFKLKLVRRMLVSSTRVRAWMRWAIDCSWAG